MRAPISPHRVTKRLVCGNMDAKLNCAYFKIQTKTQKSTNTTPSAHLDRRQKEIADDSGSIVEDPKLEPTQSTAFMHLLVDITERSIDGGHQLLHLIRFRSHI